MPRRSKKSLRRSQAAQKGWRTRKRNLAAKQANRRTSRKPGRGKKLPPKRKPSPAVVMILVTVKAKSRGRSVGRDLLVPAPSGSSLKTLREIAARTLPEKEKALAQFIRRGAVIAEGPKTRAKKAQLR